IARSPIAAVGGVLGYAGFASVFGIGASTKVVCSAYWDTCVGGGQPDTVSRLIGFLMFVIGLKLLSWALRPFLKIFQ
ncbi:MAG: hypothetical protein ACRET2_10885, partial [Steroidobacteraceae bacterium]